MSATPTSNGRQVPEDRVREALDALVPHWPTAADHKRHDAFLGLCGGLLRGGMERQAVTDFVSLLCEVTQDEEATKRLTLVENTAARLHAGDHVVGWPSLARLLGDHGEAVVGRLRETLGLDGRTIAAVYGYEDEAGCLRFQTVRYTPKDFAQRHPDGRGGWIWNLNGVERLLYRLPELLAADPGTTVFVPEGERDVDNLRAKGLVATCNPLGAGKGKWQSRFNGPLRGRNVVILPDNDAKGREHAQQVAASLVGVAASVKVLELSGLPDASDVSDWLAAGGSTEELRRLADSTPLWRATSAAKETAASRTRRVLVPYTPFPLHCLPEPVGTFVAQSAAALGCDAAFIALPLLAVLASLVGNTRSVRLKRNWFEPCIIWSLIIGDSGTLKSPALRLVVCFLLRLQQQLIRQHKQDMNDYLRRKEEYEARKREAKKEDQQDVGYPPEAPVLRRVVCSDITIEKLAEILQDNPRGTMVWRDELGGWLNSFTRYKGKNGGSDLPNWLEMNSAGPVINDRKTGDRRQIFIPRAAVSLTGGTQPATLARALTLEYLEAGLPARLMAAWPDKKPKQWTEAELHPDTEAALEEVIKRLLALEPGQDADGEPIPWALGLTREAKALWVSFYNAWAAEQAAAEGALAAALSKLEGHAARFALLHHLVKHAGTEEDSRPIGAESITAGIELTRWFAAEARRIYSMLGESEEDRETRRLIEWITQQGGRVTVKQLQRSNSRKWLTSKDAEAALENLVRHGTGRWEVDPPSGRGGKRLKWFVLSLPTTDDSDDRSDDPPPEDDGPSDDCSDDCSEGIQDDLGGLGASTHEGDSYVSGEQEAPKQSSESSVVGLHSPAHCTPEEAPGGREQSSEAIVGSRPAVEGSVAGVSADPHSNGVVVEEAQLLLRTGEPGYVLVDRPKDLEMVRQAVDESNRIGLDLETTGLDPRKDRVRLLSLATDRGLYLVDCFAVDPRPLWEVLSERPVIAHNALFDLGFLAALGFDPGPVCDTMLLSQLLHGTRHSKGFHTLAQVVQRELGEDLSKELQRSDWSGPLSREQLDYAARDASVLTPLFEALDGKVRAAGMAKVSAIESRCLPAVAWLARSGVEFDRAAWEALAQEAEREAERLAWQLEEVAPQRDGYLSRQGAWNWDSPEQVKAAFAALGITVDETDDDGLAALDNPLAELIRQYRSASKRVGTYGAKWLRHVAGDGRVYAGWRQLGADPGRMTCTKPNLQQLPRIEAYRCCFRAPEGRVLFKADYSQIELRIAAKVANDRAMLDAYARGADLHTLTAQRVLGLEEVTKQHRQLAKALNFGLLYGMGAPTFQGYAKSNYGVTLSLEQAEAYRRTFFENYPGLTSWHNRVKRAHARETRTLAGRRRLLGPKDSDTLRLNSPVQGTGADGLKLALALLWERRAECPGAFPVLAVHDEVVVEADADQVEAVEGWLRQAMVDGMAPLLDPVPVVVDVTSGPTWGG